MHKRRTFQRICIPILFCNSETREDADVVFARSSRYLPRRTRTSVRPLIRRFFLKFVSGSGGKDERLDFPLVLILSEATCISSRALSFRFPSTALSLLSINADGFPFAFRPCSCLDSFIYISLPWTSISGSSVVTYFVQQVVRISRPTYAVLIQAFQNVVGGYVLDGQKKIVPSGVNSLNVMAK